METYITTIYRRRSGFLSQPPEYRLFQQTGHLRWAYFSLH